VTTEKISEKLRRAMDQADPGETLTALIRTTSIAPDEEAQARIRPMIDAAHLATRRTDLLRLVEERYERGRPYRGDLRERTAAAHAGLLERAPQARSLWLADAVAVSGTRAELEDITGHEDVVRLEANPVFRIPEFLRTPLEDTPGLVDGSTWGVAKVAAPDVWGGFGRGDGVLIGHLDTGVDDTHPALAGKVAAFQEFDVLGNPIPSATRDSGVHGTHTAGTLVGRSFNGVNIGVAPDARLASALVLPGGSGTYTQIVAGMQWALDQGVNVINMSLGGAAYDPLWNLPVLNTLLSGVVLVVSIGNSGQGTSGGPGNDPLSIGVGATHDLDVVAGFSGGQTLQSVPWLGSPVTYNKPDISAPGVQVVSSVPGDDLASFNGTSMAAPHVTGVVALLQSTSPALKGDPFMTWAVLLGTVEDFGEAGRDQRYGFGRVDALSSAEQSAALS
jgi:subtilisin family serine protease